jgi:hypothetical protein
VLPSREGHVNVIYSVTLPSGFVATNPEASRLSTRIPRRLPPRWLGGWAGHQASPAAVAPLVAITRHEPNSSACSAAFFSTRSACW